MRLALLGIGVAIGLEIFISGGYTGSLSIQVLGIIALTIFVGLALLPANWCEEYSKWHI